jgi:hypothetical protein
VNARIRPSENMPRGAASRLSEIERRLEAIRKHIPRYSPELTTLGLLVIHIEKRQNDLCNAVLKAYELNFVEYNALIERSRHAVDRRSVVVQLTPKATRLLDELQPTVSTMMRKIYGSLSKEEVRRVTRLLLRPLAALAS